MAFSVWHKITASEWGSSVLGTRLLPLLPVPLETGMIVPVRVSSMGQIDLFANYLYLIGILDIIPCANSKETALKSIALLAWAVEYAVWTSKDG